jgi:hypothetical protein
VPFIPRKESEEESLYRKLQKGIKVKFIKDFDIPEGTFTKGTIMRLVGIPGPAVTHYYPYYTFKDDDSGQFVRLEVTEVLCFKDMFEFI